MTSVADLTETRFGMLGDGLARYVEQIIAMKSRASLLALNDVHLRMALDYCGAGISTPPEPPLYRWLALIDSLFGVNPDRPGPLTTLAPDRDEAHDQVAQATTDQRHTIIRLLTEVGTFLVVETIALNEQVEVAMAVDPSRPGLVEDRSEIDANLATAMVAGRLLLDHAEPTKLDALLIDHPRTHAASSSVDVAVAAPGQERMVPGVELLIERAEGLDSAETLRPSLVAIMVDITCDMVSLRGLLRAVLPVVEEGLLRGNWVDSRGANVVVTDVDGRLSAEVPLIPACAPDRTSGTFRTYVDFAITRVKDILLALASDPSRTSLADRPVMEAFTPHAWEEYQLNRWDAIAETLDFVATTLAAARIVVATDAFPSLGSLTAPLTPREHRIPTRYPSATGDALVPSAVVVDRLRRHALVPRLAGSAVTVVYASPVAGRRLREHWLTLLVLAGVSRGDLDILIPDVGARPLLTTRGGSGGTDRPSPPAGPISGPPHQSDVELPMSFSRDLGRSPGEIADDGEERSIVVSDRQRSCLHRVMVAAGIFGCVAVAVVIAAALFALTHLSPSSSSIVGLSLISSGWAAGRFVRTCSDGCGRTAALARLILCRRRDRYSGVDASTGSWSRAAMPVPDRTPTAR